MELLGRDPLAVRHTAGQAGAGRLVERRQTQAAGQLPEVRLGQTRLSHRTADLVLAGSLNPRTPLAIVISVDAVDNSLHPSPRGAGPHCAIKSRLAVVAAVFGIGQVVLVVELGGIQDHELDPDLPGQHLGLLKLRLGQAGASADDREHVSRTQYVRRHL